MNIGILTLKIHPNFGYIMQMYALQQVVKKLGHNPWTYQLQEESMSELDKIKQTLYNVYLHYIKGYENEIFQVFPTKQQMDVISMNIWAFIRDNIQLTDLVKDIKELRKKQFSNFDAYIVGSDQVWREAFSIDIRSYFFSYLPENAKKMAYAASFGQASLDYTRKQIRDCKKLIKSFEIVTVREDDGINICEEEFEVKAYKVLDPTLLLEKEDYMRLLLGRSFEHLSQGYILSYILDQSEAKIDYLDYLSKEKQLPVIAILPPKYNKRNRNNISSLIYPSIYDIINHFLHASYVVTDSFHGAVFSIIFEKQFAVFLNKKRGNSRFSSLLGMFGIEDRIICDDKSSLMSNIDYSSINKIKKKYQESSYALLNQFLNSNN